LHPKLATKDLSATPASLMGSANSPKACEKTGKIQQKGQADCRPVLPKSSRQATFVVRLSMIGEIGLPISPTTMFKRKSRPWSGSTELDQCQAGFRASDPLFSTD
jgi:hypothetical protein